jgi:hypothetical protein
MGGWDKVDANVRGRSDRQAFREWLERAPAQIEREHQWITALRRAALTTLQQQRDGHYDAAGEARALGELVLRAVANGEVPDALTTDKRKIGFCNQADGELAWTNLGGPARIVRHKWLGFNQDSERGTPRVHPTQKPIKLMEHLIDAYTEPGQLILDPYAGAGATLIAARRLGRRAIGVELDRKYCEAIVRRLCADDLDHDEHSAA